MDPTPIVLPVLETGALIKVVTWIKMILQNIFKIEVSGYTGWGLTVATAVIWRALGLIITTGHISLPDWPTLWQAAQLAIQALIGYGAIQNGLLGGTAKNFATKPLL